MSPVDSPVHRPTTPHPPDVEAALDEKLENSEERSRNKAWREGKAVPFKALNTSDDPLLDNETIEKNIDVTLANIEQPSSARSRKASHYLRLFKQPSTVVESSTQRKLDHESLPSPVLGDQNHDLKRLNHGQPLSSLQEEGSQAELSLLFKQLQRSPRPSSASQSPQNGPSASYFEKTSTPTKLPTPDDSNSTVSAQATTQTAKPSKQYLPAHVLEDIRSMANLTPGAQPGSSFSRSLPTSAAEKYHARIAAATVRQHDDEPTDYFQAKGQDQAQQSPASEEEDSEREQISSALYFPHRRLKTVDQSPTETQDRSGLLTIGSKRPTVLSRSESRMGQQTGNHQSPKEVEISLRSQDTEQRLHGDIPASVPTQKKDDGGQILATSIDTLSAESEVESLAGSTHSLLDYDSSATDDLGTTPTAITYKDDSKTASIAPPQPPAPLDAVELKPYNHQVGGHSTVYSFSRRAVCKQLNNRENEFYETIEREHPDFVHFLPRYIGVLNVTYRKAPKKKKAKDEAAKDKAAGNDSHKDHEEKQNAIESGKKPELQDQPRLVSHKQQIMPVPQVIFENNRHIIPDNLFRVPPRSATPDPWMSSSYSHRRNQSDFEHTSRSSTRPPMSHHSSWGVTTINKKLQEEVLRQVFAPPTIHHRHRHHHPHAISTRRAAADSTPSLAGSAPSLRRNSADISTTHSIAPEECTLKQVLKSEARRQASSSSNDTGEHISMTGSQSGNDGALFPPASNLPRRRHSGSGLVRRPLGIDCDKRHNLEFYEEEGYGGDGEDEVFVMDEERRSKHSKHGSGTRNKLDETVGGPSGQIAVRSSEGSMLPAPVTPKYGASAPLIQEPANLGQDQNQPDERSQRFILLEDLTADMSKPCVLDLKMGTRQYGIEADEKKQRSQRRKCQMTTSRELGVRVCGMQIWNIETQSYIFEDKYYGRDLKAGKEFQDALKKFFWDGITYQAANRHIPVILKKINQLERMIRRLPGYRFYASSLLMLYDRGNVEAKGKDGQSLPNDAEIKLKIVDFANCVIGEDPLPEDVPCPPQNPDGVDAGYLRGLRSLRLYFQRIWKDINNKEWVERGEGEGMARYDHDNGPGLGAVGAGWMDDTGGEDTGYVSF